MLHIIKKQALQFNIRSTADHFHTQHVISNYNRKVIIPALEKTFDLISSEDEVVSFDKIEIDIGELNLSSLEEYNSNDKIERILLEKLLKLVGSGEKQIFRKKTASLNTFEQWLFFLKKGYLPWNTNQSLDSITESVINLLRANNQYLKELQNLILHNNHVVRRLVYQHPENFLAALAGVLINKQVNDLIRIIEELYIFIQHLKTTSKEKRLTDKQTFKNIIWEYIIFQSARNTEITPAYVVQQFVYAAGMFYDRSLPYNIPQKIADRLPLCLPWIREIEGKYKNLKSTLPKPEQHFVQVFKQLVNSTETVKAKVAKTTTEDSLPSAYNKTDKKTAVINNELDDNLKTEREAPADHIGPADFEKEGIFVQHAGLVLLHPFLNNFFKNVNLVKDKNFINRKAKEKALFLLYYLATGEQKPEESLLLIPKILCDFPLEEPVKREYRLTKKEISEANGLLKACIAQWTILKKTSTGALQSEFLQRNGKLFIVNDKLQLQVEARSIDLLLDRLPWSLSIVKLPWKKEILWVEWR